MELDIVVFAAHPDDAELAMGGSIAEFTKAGLKVGVVDFSRGELGTRGNAETRNEEARESSKVLGLSLRDNLGLPDGKIRASEEFISKAVHEIRKYKPKIIFTPYQTDRHPDHAGSSQIVKEAMFFSGVEKYKTHETEDSNNIYRPKKLFYYMQTYEFKPSFIFDISASFEDKMKAIKAFQTQFFNPNSNERETFISQLNFTKFIEARAKYYGFKIGKDYGEPFYSEEEIELDLINTLKKM